MWTRQLLKENGKQAFQRNYWYCVVASLIAGLLGGGAAGASFNTGFNSAMTDYTEFNFSPVMLMFFAIGMLIVFVLAIAFNILVSNVAQVGSSRYFMENREHKTSISQILYGFRGGRYASNVWTLFMRDLHIFLWTLLLIVPGVIKSYSYMLVPYILAENPDLDRKRVLELSEKMMDGHKAEAFVLGLSFIGWVILGALTVGVLNLFYVNPYMSATYAEFYSAIKAEARQKGIFMSEELPGVSEPEVVDVF